MVEEQEFTLDELYQRCKTYNCKCGQHLPIQTMHSHTDEDDGYRVKGFRTPQWVYLECPKCGYQNAFWKLGCDA